MIIKTKVEFGFSSIGALNAFDAICKAKGLTIGQWNKPTVMKKASNEWAIEYCVSPEKKIMMIVERKKFEKNKEPLYNEYRVESLI